MLDRLLAHWPLKVLSLVIAFAIWVAITSEKHIVQDFDIPLDIQLREDHILAGEVPPTTVVVRLGGPESMIRKIDPVGLAVRLDLRDVRPGEREVQLVESHLSGAPQNAQVSFFSPDRVRLVVDNRMRRELRLAPDLRGEPPPGYHLYRTRVRPETLLVEGPEATVSELVELRTDPIQLDHRTRPFDETVGTVPGRMHVRIIDPRPVEARVVIDVAPSRRVFDAVPVVLSGRPGTASVKPPTLKVTLSGPPALLERLSADNIRAVADVEGLRPGAAPQQVAVEAAIVDLPEEQLWRLGIESVSPRDVTVRPRSESGA